VKEQYRVTLITGQELPAYPVPKLRKKISCQTVFWSVVMNMPVLLPPARQVLDELKHGLAALYGERLAGVYLYGSYARGEAISGESDLDVLVVLKGDVLGGREIARMGSLASAISMEHDLLISTMPVSAESFESLRTPFLDNAREDAVPL